MTFHSELVGMTFQLTQQLSGRDDILLGYLIRYRVQGMAKAVTTCYSARTLTQQLSGRHDIPL